MIVVIPWKQTMRYPAEHKQQTRERIVRAAARQFRRRGSEGAGIVDLMHDLRLTHGGFYRHFDSKDELFVEAFRYALQERGQRIAAAVAQAAPGTELKTVIDTYLDVAHCDDVASGCPVAALASELSRRPHGMRTALLAVLRDHTHRIATYMPGQTQEEREFKARVLLSGMAGTLSVARLLPDDEQRARLLQEARHFYFEAARR
jgi:TetR/AcrR family transcriptional repressor of nem operon